MIFCRVQGLPGQRGAEGGGASRVPRRDPERGVYFGAVGPHDFNSQNSERGSRVPEPLLIFASRCP